MISRIAVFLLALVLSLVGFYMISNNDQMFRMVEKLHDRFPFMVTLNPLSRLNSPGLSRVSSVFIGIIALLMALLLFVVVFFGRAE